VQDTARRFRKGCCATEERREETLRTGQAEEVLDYLRRFEYASRSHALLELLWHTGLRIGAVYSLDIEDYDPEEERLEMTHRPETGTALKNKSEGERMIALSRYVCEVLDDWIEHNRLDILDEYGREPLFTSEQGRLSISTMRERVYTVTQQIEDALGEIGYELRENDRDDTLSIIVPHEKPGINPEEVTRDLVYEMAQDLDIDGRSEMDKAQLIEAVEVNR
jgi:integrase